MRQVEGQIAETHVFDIEAEIGFWEEFVLQ
jgi:hypothetical protein